jgi:hypothetical protein
MMISVFYLSAYVLDGTTGRGEVRMRFYDEFGVAEQWNHRR